MAGVMLLLIWKPQQAPLQARAQYAARNVLDRRMPKATCTAPGMLVGGQLLCFQTIHLPMHCGSVLADGSIAAAPSTIMSWGLPCES